MLEPGAIATGLSARRATYVDEAGPYAAEFGRMLKKLNRNEASGISAERVTREILRPIRAGRLGRIMRWDRWPPPRSR